MQSFADYLYLLLPSPLKTIGKKVNSFWTLCRVLGRHCDELKETLLDVREQFMIITCSPTLLPIIGGERDMPRLDGEEIEQYRLRLTMKNIIAERAGTTRGIVALVKSLGFESVRVEPLFETDPTRWAEATVWISGGGLAIDDRDILQAELDTIKPASALVRLAHEQVFGGTIFFGTYVEISKIIDFRQVN